MCGLAHYLEAEGVATIVIGLVPQHVRAMRPPRALIVPFPLGRPLGAPGQPELQLDVLRHAVNLLTHDGPGPAIAAYDQDVDVEPSTDEPWSCPVSFPAPPSGSPLVDRVATEARSLAPWFDRALRLRGHTGANVSGLDIQGIIAWLGQMLEATPPTESPVPDRTIAETFKAAVEDLKAFYLEAVTAQPGDAPPQLLSNWFWDETAAGELLWALRERLADHPHDGVRLHSQATVVPRAQLDRR